MNLPSTTYDSLTAAHFMPVSSSTLPSEFRTSLKLSVASTVTRSSTSTGTFWYSGSRSRLPEDAPSMSNSSRRGSS